MDKEIVYLIYDKADPNKELYAWTHNVEYAKLFIKSRKPGRFKMRCKRCKLNDGLDRFNLGRWKNDHRGKMLTISYLGGQDPYLELPVTYYEDFEVGRECDKIYDSIFTMAKELSEIPFEDELLEAIQYTAEVARHRDNISFDTFKVFMKLFGDTVL